MNENVFNDSCHIDRVLQNALIGLLSTQDVV